MVVGVLTPSGTLGRLNELVHAGFRLTDISSTTETVTIELEKGDRRTRLELEAEDARSLLNGQMPKTTHRIAAHGTR